MMRIALRFLLLFIPILIVVVYLFMGSMRHLEHEWALKDLQQRAHLVADTLGISLREHIRNNRNSTVRHTLSRIGPDSRLLGVSVCSVKGSLIAKSEAIPRALECPENSLLPLDDGLFNYKGQRLHYADYRLRENDGSTLAIFNIFQNSAQLESRAAATQKYILLTFAGLGIVVSLLTLGVYRWTVRAPLDQLTRTLRFIAAGRTRFVKAFDNTDLGPLVRNLEKVLSDVRRTKAPQENSPNGIWNATKLRSETNRLFGNAKFCVVANREPYIHNKKGGKIEVQFPSSGLVSAVEPILRACSGLWIGHGSGTADKETADKNGVVLVPPNRPEYALKRVWLTKEEEQGYYFGFANEGLWPLCHIAHTRPTFRKEDWAHYQGVNKKFADAYNNEMKGQNTIALIQDYHFALLPGILRRLRPETISSLFWHIPWPNPESIAICPWKNEIMRGMLGADLIGFHTQFHCNNFLDSVDRFLEARVDRENFSVTIKGHTCYVKPFPISIEWPPRNNVDGSEIPKIRQELHEELGLPKNALVGVGVDRLDYTKGIIERFLAVERFLEKNPKYVGRFVFIQIGAPSRTQIKRYQDFNSEVLEVANRVNWRFGQEGYAPIMLRMEHHDASEVFRFYRGANLCYVSSLHDGMNLVAKEFIAARSDNDGALVLSSFTGAAKELLDALIVNPYDIEENADALLMAIEMSPMERRQRMIRLRNVVSTNNVYTWAAQFLNEVHHISDGRRIREISQVI